MQINLSYSSVTDVGLLSLASISCLQSMTILHLKGLTASGLAAALLACGGLTKVKLQASFKSLLPQPLFEHLEARGCMFQWRDKVFQVYLICLFSFFPPMKQYLSFYYYSNLIVILVICSSPITEFLFHCCAFPILYLNAHSNTHVIV